MNEEGDSSSSCETGPQDAGPAEDRQRISWSIVRRSGDWTGLEPVDDLVARCASAVTGALRLPYGTGEVAFALMSDADIQALNHTFRDQNKPTNVLSFATPVPRGTGTSCVPMFLGDVALAAETLGKEAHELGIPLDHHFQHLVVHGLLHLFGYDHETDDEAQLMEGLETQVLTRLGVPDPYSDNISQHGERAGPISRAEHEQPR